METSILNELKKETAKVIASIEAYNNSTERFYKSIPTECMKAIAKYGAENIFMTGQSYSSHYHDDYASFSYYNNVTGEEFTDSWTTAAACPSYGSYECFSFKSAVKNGLVNMEKYLLLLRSKNKRWVEHERHDRQFSIDELIRFKLPIKVERGRKWKGTGYVVSKHTSSFGRFGTTYAVVYDEKNNELREVNPDFIEVIGLEEIVNEWKKEMYDRIEVSTVQNLQVTSDGIIEQNFFVHFEKWLLAKCEGVEIDTSSASYPEQKIRDDRKQDFKSRKIEELVKWVKDNTDKTGDDILVLAERIYNKRYA